MLSVKQLQPIVGEVDLFTVYAQPDPGVRVNFVESIDGAATLDGRSDGLSSPGDKQLFRVLRAMSDVVLVGAGTARIEKYGPMSMPPDLTSWRLARGMPAVPELAVVSGSLDLDPDSKLFRDPANRPLILTREEAPAERRAQLSRVADVVSGDSVATWLRLLTERGLTRVLCEGGPRLFGTLLADGHVAELCLTLSPLMVGQVAPRIAHAAAQAAPHRFDLMHVLEEDGYLFLRYAAHSG